MAVFYGALLAGQGPCRSCEDIHLMRMLLLAFCSTVSVCCYEHFESQIVALVHTNHLLKFS